MSNSDFSHLLWHLFHMPTPKQLMHIDWCLTMHAAHGIYSPELLVPVAGAGVSRVASKHTAPTALRCLKISPNGSHLAIGECVYSKCLVFSVGRQQIAPAALRCLKVSPNGIHLAIGECVYSKCLVLADNKLPPPHYGV
jgi:hypothetical protein